MKLQSFKIYVVSLVRPLNAFHRGIIVWQIEIIKRCIRNIFCFCNFDYIVHIVHIVYIVQTYSTSVLTTNAMVLLCWTFLSNIPVNVGKVLSFFSLYFNVRKQNMSTRITNSYVTKVFLHSFTCNVVEKRCCIKTHSWCFITLPYLT